MVLARQKQGLPEMGVLRESDSSWYMREEAGGPLTEEQRAHVDDVWSGLVPVRSQVRYRLRRLKSPPTASKTA